MIKCRRVVMMRMMKKGVKVLMEMSNPSSDVKE
jgi:hypothetical protein